MASERDLELLDDYISNRLTGADRAYIEKKLEQDPDLRAEYSLQQQIADGLRKARTAQLKAMLNSVPVPSAGGASDVTRVVIVSVIALCTLLVAFYLWPSETTPVPQNNPVTQEESPAQADVPAEELPETPAAQVTETPAEESKPATAPTSGAVSETYQPETSDQNTSRIDPFDPTPEHESTDPIIPETSVPSVGEASMKTPEIIVETDNTNKKYSFHYQMKDDKLILYGSFEKNVYEILEFIAAEKRTVFLFYRDNYYLLDSDTEKITPLVPVQDAELLSKLKRHRATTR